MSSWFYGFPFNLFWGLVFGYLYYISGKKSYVFPVLIMLAGLGLSLGLDTTGMIQFWRPGGIATVISSTLIAYLLLANKTLAEFSPDYRVPDRQSLRNSFDETVLPEKRQEIYKGVVRKNSLMLSLLEEKVTPRNTRFLLLALFITSFVLFFVLKFFFFHTEVFDRVMTQEIELLMTEPGYFSPHEFMTLVYDYSPFFIFIENTLYFFIIYHFCRLALSRVEARLSVFGNLMFFRIPDLWVWVYILMAVIVILTTRYLPKSEWLHIPRNLLLLGTFLYIIQSFSTLWLFLQVRLLPSMGIISFAILMALIFRPVAAILLLGMLLVGILEFWFNFRKKALHPRLLSNDA